MMCSGVHVLMFGQQTYESPLEKKSHPPIWVTFITYFYFKASRIQTLNIFVPFVFRFVPLCLKIVRENVTYFT